jgi:hypothetical protein
MAIRYQVAIAYLSGVLMNCTFQPVLSRSNGLEQFLSPPEF